MADQEQLTDVQGSASEQPQPSAPTKDTSADNYWKSKHDGLQGFVSKLKKDYDAVRLQYDDFKSKAAEEMTALAAERDRLQKEYEQIRAQHEATAKELAMFRKRFEISRVVSSEYPELMPLYNDGLLIGVESLEGDDLKSFLARYQERVKGLVNEKVVGDARGSTPPPPTSAAPTAVTRESLLREVENARRQFGFSSKEYASAMQAYQQFLANSAKS